MLSRRHAKIHAIAVQSCRRRFPLRDSENVESARDRESRDPSLKVSMTPRQPPTRKTDRMRDKPALEPLLRAAADGDREAFRVLYEATSAQLFAVALRILKRRALAEEVLQDAYLRIWQRAGSYRRAYGAPMTWMVAIVRNGAIDVLRRRQDRLESGGQDGGDEMAALADRGPDPFALTAQSEALAALLACLERISEKERDCVLMAYYHGYTHSEIAGRMAEPLGTIKSRIHRALARIRDCLGHG